MHQNQHLRIKMEERKPKILADSIENFKIIEEQLLKLPRAVYRNIEVARAGFLGVECDYIETFGEELVVCIPKWTTQINDFGDYIGIYCNPFFIKISGSMFGKQKIKYLIIQDESGSN